MLPALPPRKSAPHLVVPAPAAPVVVQPYLRRPHCRLQPCPPSWRKVTPSETELTDIKSGLARALNKSDAKTRALVKKYPDLIQVRPPPAINSAIIPQLQGGFIQKHQGNLEVARQGDANLLFMGDSITDFWRGDRAPYNGKAIQEKYFSQWKVANYGIAGDTTQGVLYRLHDGEGTGIKPKAIMLMIGTNNTGRNSAPEIAEGVGAIVMELQKGLSGRTHPAAGHLPARQSRRPGPLHHRRHQQDHFAPR